MARLARLLLIALFLAPLAARAVTYTVTFDQTRFVDEYGNEPVFGGMFVVRTESPIVSEVELPTVSCALNGAPSRYGCYPNQYFAPTETHTGFAMVGVQLWMAPYETPFRGFLWFEAGAFETEGVHAIYTGLVTDGTEEYENFASIGTLQVSLAPVPEAAGAATMLAGLAVLAGALRRRPG